MRNDDVADFFESFATLPSYPLFIKPVIEGSSKGIDGFNKVKEPADLEPAVRELAQKFPGQDILVERFLSGREFTVSILGTGSHSRVIGIREHIWQTSPNQSNKDDSQSNGSLDFASRESKSSNGTKMLLYNDLHDMDEPHIKATCEVALRTWKVLNCRDAGRVDLRFDSDEPGSSPNVLEVSTSIILIISDARYS